MKALTIWQPWASLVMILAKPIEWRKWAYTDRNPGLVDKRIVIHAGSRPIRPQEVFDIRKRLEDGNSSLIPELALPLIEKLLAAPKCRGVLPLAAALGTAILRKPRSVDSLFSQPDSDRVTHHMFGWPLSDVRRFDEPIPMRGMQGFWNCSIKEAA